jgi:hypothetical protein
VVARAEDGLTASPLKHAAILPTFNATAPERLRQARQIAAEVAERQADPDGHIRFPGHYYYATAIRTVHRPVGTS